MAVAHSYCYKLLIKGSKEKPGTGLKQQCFAGAQLRTGLHDHGNTSANQEGDAEN